MNHDDTTYRDDSDRAIVGLAVEVSSRLVAVAFDASSPAPQLLVLSWDDLRPTCQLPSGTEGEGDEVVALTFVSHDTIAFASSAGQQRVEQINIGSKRRSVVAESTRFVRSVAGCIGGYAVVSGETAQVLDLAGHALREWRGSVNPIDHNTFAPIACSARGTIGLAGREPNLLEWWEDHSAPAPRLVATDGPARARWAGFDGSGRLFGVIDNDLEMVGVWNADLGTRHLPDYFGRNLALSAVASFDPTGPRLAVGLLSGVVQIHDLVNGLELASRRVHRGRVTGLAFGPSGHLVSAGDDGLINIWKTRLPAEPGPAEESRL